VYTYTICMCVGVARGEAGKDFQGLCRNARAGSDKTRPVEIVSGCQKPRAVATASPRSRAPERIILCIYSLPPTILFLVNPVKATYCITPRPQSFPTSYLYMCVCVCVLLMPTVRAHVQNDDDWGNDDEGVFVCCEDGVGRVRTVARRRLPFTTTRPLYTHSTKQPLGVTARLLITSSGGWHNIIYTMVSSKREWVSERGGNGATRREFKGVSPAAPQFLFTAVIVIPIVWDIFCGVIDENIF